jgi:hypothetical protein
MPHSPIFDATFTDGTQVRMTTWHDKDHKSLDLARGVRLAIAAYKTRHPSNPVPSFKEARFERDGEVLQRYPAQELEEALLVTIKLSAYQFRLRCFEAVNMFSINSDSDGAVVADQVFDRIARLLRPYFPDWSIEQLDLLLLDERRRAADEIGALVEGIVTATAHPPWRRPPR